jgi:hypothetical protein
MFVLRIKGNGKDDKRGVSGFAVGGQQVQK